MNLIGSNKPLFAFREQLEIVNRNRSIMDRLLENVNNVFTWNQFREILKSEALGTEREKIMLFGYVDGVIHPYMFGKKR